MRSRKNAVPVPVTRDLLQEKQTEVARLARQASEAVDIVTRTMNELEGINQQIDNDLAEIDTYSKELAATRAAMSQQRKNNTAIIMAISALRTQQKQESECANCSGIVYRQTDSGKIIPVDQRCGVKITPPCYVPDGDGCAYQIYGDNNDEPIARCKSCPLCQSDKIRHKQEPAHNDPLVLDELRQMRGEPVWCKELECYGIVKMEKVGSWANELFLVGTWHNGDAAVNFEYDIKSRGLTLYRHKPEEGMV